jgi:hypothetical protein
MEISTVEVRILLRQKVIECVELLDGVGRMRIYSIMTVFSQQKQDIGSFCEDYDDTY